jgi:hypothetical protein
MLAKNFLLFCHDWLKRCGLIDSLDSNKNWPRTHAD